MKDYLHIENAFRQIGIEGIGSNLSKALLAIFTCNNYQIKNDLLIDLILAKQEYSDIQILGAASVYAYYRRIEILTDLLVNGKLDSELVTNQMIRDLMSITSARIQLRKIANIMLSTEVKNVIRLNKGILLEALSKNSGDLLSLTNPKLHLSGRIENCGQLGLVSNNECKFIEKELPENVKLKIFYDHNSFMKYVLTQNQPIINLVFPKVLEMKWGDRYIVLNKGAYSCLSGVLYTNSDEVLNFHFYRSIYKYKSDYLSLYSDFVGGVSGGNQRGLRDIYPEMYYLPDFLESTYVNNVLYSDYLKIVPDNNSNFEVATNMSKREIYIVYTPQ